MRQGSRVVRRRSLFRSLARGAGWLALALACLFGGLVALYAFVPPVSTLMLARSIEGKSYERLYVRLKEIAPLAIASSVCRRTISARLARAIGPSVVS